MCGATRAKAKMEGKPPLRTRQAICFQDSDPFVLSFLSLLSDTSIIGIDTGCLVESEGSFASSGLSTSVEESDAGQSGWSHGDGETTVSSSEGDG